MKLKVYQKGKGIAQSSGVPLIAQSSNPELEEEMGEREIGREKSVAFVCKMIVKKCKKCIFASQKA